MKSSSDKTPTHHLLGCNDIFLERVLASADSTCNFHVMRNEIRPFVTALLASFVLMRLNP